MIFLDFVALTTDVETVFGVGYADALEVEVLNGCVGIVNSHALHTGTGIGVEGYEEHRYVGRFYLAAVGEGQQRPSGR